MERAHVGLAGELGLIEHLAPGIDGVAGKAWGHVARSIQAEHMKSVGEPVKTQRAGDRDDVAAIDEPAAEALLTFPVLVEMHACGVLEQTGGELVLGLLYGLAVHMVDLVADGVVFPVARRAGERIVCLLYTSP